MSGKLEQDFDIYYAELRNFTEGFKTSSQEIETDKMLSRAGKFEQIEKLKAEHLKSVNELGERFQGDFDKRVSNIERSLNGKKKNAVLDSIERRFSKGEDISSDESSQLLLHGMSENRLLMRKSGFQNMLSSADEKQLRKTAQSLSDNQDTEKLEWLREMVSLRGDEAFSSTIQAQVDGIRDANLNDEQLKMKQLSERIERGVKLFQYSVERSKTGVYMDVRQEEIIDDGD